MRQERDSKHPSMAIPTMSKALACLKECYVTDVVFVCYDAVSRDVLCVAYVAYASRDGSV
jgi:hypothetical protein